MTNKDSLTYIAFILHRFGHAYIPAFGTLSIVDHSAEFTENRSVLNPPYQSVSFTEEAHTEFEFTTLLTKSGVEHNQAVQIFNHISDEIQKKIQANKIFSIPEIGDFFYADEKLNYRALSEKFESEYYGLEAIRVHPIPIGHARNNFPLLNLKGIESGEKILKRQIFSIKDYFLPVLAIIFTMLLLGLRYMSCHTEEYKISAPIEESVSKPQESESDIKPEPLDTLEQTNIPVESSDSDVIVGDKCTIIVGSFTNAKNAQRMLSKVENAGYIPYFQQYDGYVRVGMTFECKTEDLTDSMYSMRRKFAKDAWYLEPKIAIENK